MNYQPPRYPPVPRSARSGLTVVAAALGAVFVVATAIVAYVANHPGTSNRAQAGVQGRSVGVSGGQQPVGPSAETLRPSAATSSYSPPPVITPTLSLLNSEAINRTFEGYMNALVDHDLTALRSATCPRLRPTLKGFELHGKYVSRWRGRPYQIYPGQDYVQLSATVQLRSPISGAAAGQATYDWYVQRSSGHYYVCGFLS